MSPDIATLGWGPLSLLVVTPLQANRGRKEIHLTCVAGHVSVMPRACLSLGPDPRVSVFLTSCSVHCAS